MRARWQVIFLAAILSKMASAQGILGTIDTEQTPGGPFAAEETARTAELPPGFQLQVFASEPMIRQPIAMNWDTRGRLWVAENDTYADQNLVNDRGYDLNFKDRIVVLEDTDLDGRADQRTVFNDQLQRLTSVLPGLGGVWVLAAPDLLFFPDSDGDLKPDAPPQVRLTGWTTQARHNTVNGLKWGPDGWLYGRNGIIGNSTVGTPESAESDRVRMGPGIWRFHPARNRFEIFCEGTTNPWGHDWDRHGELFFINTVIGHLWHGIPGAQFRRMSGDPLRPFSYGFLEQHADHFHFDTGEGWTATRRGAPSDATDALGGGHAHQGLIIYQGLQWPEEWRGRLLTVNLHGHRLNAERLERVGTGYVARHEPDFAKFKDPWFRGLDFLEDHDGSVLLSDWSDAGECHDNDGIHRSSGRLYRITYGSPRPAAAPNLTLESPADLARRQLGSHEQLARLARIELHTRHRAGADLAVVRDILQTALNDKATPIVPRLRAMWSLHTLEMIDSELLYPALAHSDEHIRTAAIRLLVDRDTPDQAAFDRFAKLAVSDSSGLVRLALASALQRVPRQAGTVIAEALAMRDEDTQDHNQPHLLWLGIEPQVVSHPEWAVRLALRTPFRLLRQNIVRRLTEEHAKQPMLLSRLLDTAKMSNSKNRASQTIDHQALSSEVISDLLTGMELALDGLSKAEVPTAWAAFISSFDPAKTPTELMDRLEVLGAIFDEPKSLQALRERMADTDIDPARRSAALTALGRVRDSALDNQLLALLDDPALATATLARLATRDAPKFSAAVVQRLAHRTPEERNALIASLASRKHGAAALLEAVASKQLASSELNAFHARQIKSLDDSGLNEKLSAVWGNINESSQDKQKLLAEYTRTFDRASLGRANLESGREVYRKVCGACHQLFGEGGKIGPDLTGGNRKHLAYLLENIIDPSALVPEAYRLSIILLEDGRTLTGVVVSENESKLVLQTPTEQLTIPVAEISARKNSPASLMPEGLLTALPKDQALALIAYLTN